MCSPSPHPMRNLRRCLTRPQHLPLLGQAGREARHLSEQLWTTYEYQHARYGRHVTGILPHSRMHQRCPGLRRLAWQESKSYPNSPIRQTWQQPAGHVLRMHAEETARVGESSYPLHPPSSSATQMLTHSFCHAQTFTETSCLVTRCSKERRRGSSWPCYHTARGPKSPPEIAARPASRYSRIFYLHKA